MRYTEEDQRNAMKYESQRAKLALARTMWSVGLKNIASRLDTKVRQATLEDYYYPTKFRDRAIWVDVELTREACEILNCNVTGPNGSCKSSDAPVYYRLGEEDRFELACQPSCYNLRSLQQVDGKEQPQMMRLKWHKNRCAIVSSEMAWFEMPRYRATEPTRHVTDLPTGFNRDDEGSPLTTTGLTYHFNKSYCDAFFDQYDPVKRVCYESTLQIILNNVVGEQMVKMVQEGAKYVKDVFSLPSQPFPPPPPVPDKWTLDNWRNDYDRGFVPTDPNINMSDLLRDAPAAKRARRAAETVDALPRHITDDVARYREIVRTSIGQALDRTAKSLVPIGDTIVNGRQFTRSVGEAGVKVGTAVVNAFEQVGKDMRDMIYYMSTKEGRRDLGISAGEELIEWGLKKGLKVILTKLVPYLEKSAASAAAKGLLLNVFRSSFVATMKRVVTRVALRLLSSLVRNVAQLLLKLTSVVGIVLAIVNVIDLILSFWDPFNYNAKYPPTVFTDYMFNMESSQRETLRTPDPVMNFELLCAMVLTDEQVLETTVDSMGYMYEYLDALDVNSEGARIDKGDAMLPINDDEANTTAKDQTRARMHVYTPEEFRRYHEDHTLRLRCLKAMDFIAVSATVAAMACLMLRLATLTILLTVFLTSITLARGYVINCEASVIVEQRELIDQVLVYREEARLAL